MMLDKNKLKELSSLAEKEHVDHTIKYMRYHGRLYFTMEFLMTKGLADIIEMEILTNSDVSNTINHNTVLSFIFNLQSIGIKNPYRIDGKEALSAYIYCIFHPKFKRDWINYASKNTLKNYWPFD